ncbi:MAG TPA: JAB domain-containing protein [Chloroflexi bacterium]|nr:JAB domain-containing protein [Chloroflexota bacterium]
MGVNTRSEYCLTIKDLPVDERPRERLEHAGEGALSTAELLAIILRTGMGGESVLNLAQRLLSTYGGLPGLARASFAELEAEKGLGKAKTAQLKAALELGRRILLAAPEERFIVRSPSDVAQLLIAEMSHLDQEHFRVLYLDTRNRLLGIETVYVGSLNASHIRIGEVFREAVKRNCAAIIVAHNHPSGDPTPSPEDVQVTRQLVEAGELLGIEMLDHLVIGQQRFVSLRERGLGFS